MQNFTLRTGVFAALFAAACAQAMADEADELVAYGRELIETNCSSCHAVSATDESTHPEAPPFRELSQRYPLEALEEAFAEGIVVGHPDMPVFIAEPDQIDAILTYLATLQ
ncbi:cytochrome c [Nitratireductor aquimarinus]|uniref:c-type cytochrome n=1 Tax=Nitratireductor aquimarinus TaxID=889300 RepID=UPI0029368FB3|nr:cytochrome c [Nitratireductor aquimarinus]MDV2965764.1 cytochrome c [Nitratireductor aquimarinus]